MIIKEYKQIPNDIINARIKVFVKEQKIDPKDELTGDDGEYTHLGLYENGKLISTARYKIENSSIIVGRVLTLKEYRNKGFQTKIFQYIENIAKNNNINSIIVHSQITAINFYSKNGFKIISDKYFDAGIIHYTMEKQLN